MTTAVLSPAVCAYHAGRFRCTLPAGHTGDHLVNVWPEGSWGYEAEKVLAQANALPWYLWPFKWHIRRSIANVRKRNRRAIQQNLRWFRKKYGCDPAQRYAGYK